MFAILPVKPLAEGKTRLGRILSDAERGALNRDLLERTIDLCVAVLGCERTIVVSRDRQVLDIARGRGLRPVEEAAEGGLNRALRDAAGEAIRLGADAVLVLPVDLVHLTADDIEALVRSRASGRGVAIAPDRLERGTNALLVAPPDAIAFSFGPNSLRAHLAAAREAGIEPVVVRRKGLAFDVDTPEDHALIDRTDGQREEKR